MSLSVQLREPDSATPSICMEVIGFTILVARQMRCSSRDKHATNTKLDAPNCTGVKVAKLFAGLAAKRMGFLTILSRIQTGRRAW